MRYLRSDDTDSPQPIRLEMEGQYRVEREMRTYLEKRMMLIRRQVLKLGRYGLGTRYYVTELAKLEGIARKTREELERSILQLTLTDTE